MSPTEALDALFRENELPMSDRNGVLYDTIRAALAEAEKHDALKDGWKIAEELDRRREARNVRLGLAESAEAEPVAWRVQRTDKAYELFFNKHMAERAAACYLKKPEVEPLYTHPPAREAEPVDEEVIAECERIEGRTWWTGGTWLYPGDTVVVRRAAARGKG